jgi:hypothetical protein
MTLAATAGIWLVLMVLIGSELIVRGVTALVIGAAMAAIVALTYMRLARHRDVSSAFALATVFWLLVLLGLGSMDPATRHDIPVSQHAAP